MATNGAFIVDKSKRGALTRREREGERHRSFPEQHRAQQKFISKLQLKWRRSNVLLKQKWSFEVSQISKINTLKCRHSYLGRMRWGLN